MLNDEFIKNLEAMDPARREQTMALMRAISSPPERVLDLLDRLEIPWERKHIDGQSFLVAKWSDVSAGEKRNQEQGPILKRLMEEAGAQGNSATSSPFEAKAEPVAEFPGGMKVEPKEPGGQ